MLWTLVLASVVGSAWGDGGHVESRVVITKQGPIRGYKSPDGELFVFYDVPYATAPSGSQKFQAPLPPPVTMDIFEAVERNIICPQFNYYALDHKQSRENCLVANIYVPQTEEKHLPVLVYVHGGSFAAGFGDIATPIHLAMTKKAVIINFNYRLGPHGFLCLGTKDIPGNAGMKDQVALLRWVKDNIAGFGGNPHDVTIAGYSAGAISVNLLMLSKMANGLFNKVTPESGATTTIFAVQQNPTELAKIYAKLLNFTNVDDIDALDEFYKTASYDLLTSVNMLIAFDSMTIFSPCVERDVGVERFLDDSPVNILKCGNYQQRPMLYGFTKNEGMLRLNLFEIWIDKMNKNFSIFLPADLRFHDEDEKQEVAHRVKYFYFGAEPVSGENILKYVDYFTDTIIAYPTLLSVRLQMEAGNDQIYLYEYDYTDESSPVIPYIGIHGADHAAQSRAIQDGLNVTHFDESMASDEYKKIKQTLREMWMNFVKTSKPVPEGSSLPQWSPTGPNASPYMLLDQISELKWTPLLERRMQFWDEIYRKHYRQPVPPRIPEKQQSSLRGRPHGGH